MKDEHYTPTDDGTVRANSYNVLRDCNAANGSRGPSAYTGAGKALNSVYSPAIFFVTPFTSDDDRNKYQIITRYRYQSKVERLAQALSQLVPSAPVPVLVGYTRRDSEESTKEEGIAGRATLEVDPLRYFMSNREDHDVCPLQIGLWRLWTED